jgi:hypothetical protein
MIHQILFAVGVGWVLYSAITLVTNVHRARRMGVSLVIVPISPMNALWIVVEPLVFTILDHSPIKFDTFGRYARRGWHFRDKAASHVELGDAWALVTPGEIWLHVCNPEAINDIFGRRQDFIRPSKLYSTSSLHTNNSEDILT